MRQHKKNAPTVRGAKGGLWWGNSHGVALATFSFYAKWLGCAISF